MTVRRVCEACGLTGGDHVGAGIVPRRQADDLVRLQEDARGVASDALGQGILQVGCRGRAGRAAPRVEGSRGPGDCMGQQRLAVGSKRQC